MKELPRKLAAAPPERGRAARVRCVCKTKGKKGGKAKILPQTPSFLPSRLKEPPFSGRN